MRNAILFLLSFLSILIIAKETDSNEGEINKKNLYEMNIVQKNDELFKDNRDIELINKETIKKTDKGSIKSLFEESGINLQQTGAGQLSPFLRGLTGQHTLLVFDGIRLNSSIFRYGPNQYTAILDSNIIGKIEILKGAAPTLYGSDAIGGVIAFSSEDLNKRLDFISKYSSSSNSMGLHTDLADQIGDLKFNLQVSLNDFQNLEGSSDIGVQKFTSYQNKAVTAKFNYNISQKLGDLTLLGTYFTQNNGYRTDKSKINDYRIYPNQNHGIYYLKYKNYLSNIKTSLNSTIYFQKTYEEYKRFKNNSLSDERLDDLYQYGLNIRATSKFNDFTSYNGMEFVYDYLRSDGNYYDKSNYNTFSLFTKEEYKISDLLFGLGARYTFIYLAEVENASYSKNNLSFSAFAQYHVNQNYNISLNFAQGFRAPNLNDLTGSFEYNGGYEFGNTDLSAENSYMFEFVNKFQMSGLFVSFSAYYSILKGFISRKEIDKPTGYEEYEQVVQKENVNNGYIYGLDFSFLYKYKKLLEFKFNINYTYGMMDEIVDNNTLETELHPMQRIPPLQGLFKITYNLNHKFSMFYRAQFASEQNQLSDADIKDSRIPEGGTPGYIVSSLGFYAKLKAFTLTASLENLSDQKYKYHGAGFYEAGRNFYLKLEGNF
jgi:outer membrane receptor protein involved in Fe transport